MGVAASINCGKQLSRYSILSPDWCHIGDLVLHDMELYLILGRGGYRGATIYKVPMTKDKTIDFNAIPDEPTMLEMLKNRKNTRDIFLNRYVSNLSPIYPCYRGSWDECIAKIKQYWTVGGGGDIHKSAMAEYC